MILYFADRGLNVLGLAGDKIKKGYNIENDEREIDVSSGVATFSFDLSYKDENRKEVEKLLAVGNYILHYGEINKEYETYTIIDSDQDTAAKSFHIYAEDIGLDLLNDVCLPFNVETADTSTSPNYTEEQYSPNKGYVDTNGSFISDSNYWSTNYVSISVPASGAFLYQVSKSDTQSRRFSEAYFDANKQFIKTNYRYVSDSSQTSRSEAPSNAKFVRLSFHTVFDDARFVASTVKAYSISQYIGTAISNSGFEIGTNEVGSVLYPLELSDSQTASERIKEIAEFFGAEVSFSYSFSGLRITHKYLNIHNHRGADNRVELRLGVDVKNIRVKKSVAELATAILALGVTSDSDGGTAYFTLNGYNGTIENGYYIQDNKLCSRAAFAKWSRYLSVSGQRSGHIVKKYEYECDSQKTLYENALKDLKAIEKESVEYEVELYSLPKGVNLGDTVYIVDDIGEIYISARVLTIKTSEVNDTIDITLGDFVTKSSGIVDEWALWSQKFSKWADAHATKYLWVAYADDDKGTGISLDPTGKNWMGMADNMRTDIVDLSDPTIFKWIQLTAKDGKDGASIRSTTISYAKSASVSVMPADADWSATLPTDIQKGEVLWTRTVIDYTDDTIPDTISYSYAIQGRDGERGFSVTVESIKYISWASGTQYPPSDEALWDDDPVFVPDGYFLWTKTTFSDGHIAYGVAKQGEKGDEAFSPIIDVSKTGGTSTITITDADGVKTVTVEDGAKGDKGDKGDKGEDGKEVVSKVDYYGISDNGETYVNSHAYRVDSALIYSYSDRTVTKKTIITDGSPVTTEEAYITGNAVARPVESMKVTINVPCTGFTLTLSSETEETSETTYTIDFGKTVSSGTFDAVTSSFKDEISGEEFTVEPKVDIRMLNGPQTLTFTPTDPGAIVAQDPYNFLVDLSYWTESNFTWGTEYESTNKFSNYLWWYYVETYSDQTEYVSVPVVINSVDSRVTEVEEQSNAYYRQTSDSIELLSNYKNELVQTQEQLSGNITENRTLLNELQTKLELKDGEISALTRRIDELNGTVKWAETFLDEKGLNVRDSSNTNTITTVTGDGVNISNSDGTETLLNVNSTNSTIHNTTITGYANIGGASFSRKQETEYDGTASWGVAIYN